MQELITQVQLLSIQYQLAKRAHTTGNIQSLKKAIDLASVIESRIADIMIADEKLEPKDREAFINNLPLTIIGQCHTVITESLQVKEELRQEVQRVLDM